MSYFTAMSLNQLRHPGGELTDAAPVLCPKRAVFRQTISYSPPKKRGKHEYVYGDKAPTP